MTIDIDPERIPERLKIDIGLERTALRTRIAVARSMRDSTLVEALEDDEANLTDQVDLLRNTSLFIDSLKRPVEFPHAEFKKAYKQF